MSSPAAASAERSIEAGVAELCAGLPAVATTESIDTAHAVGRVLAGDLLATLDLPGFDNAAMDGHAVRTADLAGGPVRLVVAGTALAGRSCTATLAPGQCVRIMTGAPLPGGADAVVMLEDGAADGDAAVRLPGGVAAGSHVRRRGEHVRCGDVVLPAGTTLGGPEVGLALSVGHARVTVRRRLRVGVLSTGDELADPPATLPPGGSYDANRAFLLAGVRALGAEAVDLGICPDDGAAFSARIARAFDERLDALVCTGGAAQGDADVVRQAGGVGFVPLDVRPGRGVAHARLPRVGAEGAAATSGAAPLLLLGLPGNAVAAFVMFHLVARPVLQVMAGALPRPLPRLRLPLAQPAKVRGGRIDWRRGLLRADGVALLREQGSAMLRTIVDADVLVALGPQAEFAAGDAVEVILLRGAAG